MLDALVKDDPTALMLVNAVTGQRLTVSEFDRENRAWARRLSALGVQPGDNVATMMGPTTDAYSAWLGLCGLGAVEVPINPQLRGLSLSYLLDNSEAHTLITQRAFFDQLTELAPSLEHLETVVVVDSDAEFPANLPFTVLTGSAFRAQEKPVEYRLAQRHDIACIIYTSGTTGPPKGVMIPWGWLSSGTDLVPSRVEGGTRYSFLSPAHMSGKGALNNAIAEKRALVLRETFSVREFWNDIARYDCRVSQLFPPMIKYLLAAPVSETDHLTPLQHIWIAPLIPETRAFMQRFGIAITTGFGSTEVGGPIAGIDVDGTNLKSCGTVNPEARGYEVRIVDEYDRELPPGEIGELIVRASAPWTLNAGYYRNPEATAEAWRNGWFHTGDALTRDEEGNFYFVDRNKDCIRRRGENISSFELESYALGYPGIEEAAAVGVASDDGEQEVKIFLVAKPGEAVNLDEMGAWLHDQMPKFMTPRYLEILPSFPKTPATERVQKAALRALPASAGQWDRHAAMTSRTSPGPAVGAATPE
jgi:crotonobetaine/carnitine-CoA ligase